MVNFGRFKRMNSNKIKLRHYIATHTFHSPGKMKEFKSAFKHRKKNSDWFNTETPNVTEFFFRCRTYSEHNWVYSEELFFFYKNPFCSAEHKIN